MLFGTPEIPAVHGESTSLEQRKMEKQERSGKTNCKRNGEVPKLVPNENTQKQQINMSTTFEKDLTRLMSSIDSKLLMSEKRE